MDAETKELVLANRAFLYGLVARAFAEEPDEVFADILRGQHACDEVALVDDGFSPALTASFAAMVECLHTSGVDGLRAQYTRLFVGPGTLPCSPWETMHTTGKRVLFQAGVLDVRDAYREAGFLPARYPAVADDFIGLECDFLAKLAQDAYEAYGEGDSARLTLRLGQARSFLEKHLLKWIDGLGRAMEEQCGPGFYSEAARMAGALGRRDLELLPALMG